MNSQKIIINTVKQIVDMVVPMFVFPLKAKPINVTIEEAKILAMLLPNNIADIDNS